ncbi:glycoside hydrolase family 10 protein [Synechococcus sp. CBW1108]|uniref:glycoside hydrolase family 10 protein n=1 Tax=Synechococcus sp. CBW1108 TaxID=1353147 RepID=UPI0018CF2E62|nr:family 10 glycosylhydrolase [Synechococcus sp. CBW1108]QPN70480.1 family 10 glycosylhydrolase [Synechococcus sp. CBW1108]
MKPAPLRRFARLKAFLPAAVSLVLTLPWALAPLPLLAQSQPAPSRRIGVWLTNSPSPLYYDPARIDRAVRELADAGFNTLYPNVWSRGATFHSSRHAPMEPALAKANPNLDPICRFTQAAHRRGLQVIPWFEYGLMEPADAAVVAQNPDWVLQRRDGSSEMAMHGKPMVWLNPAHPGVRQRFLGLIGEIVQRCNVDGIQLDDHFAWPVELGYDPFSRARYLAETGLEPPDDHTERAWMRWRRQQLTGLLRELRSQLKRSGTLISLSPGPFRFAYNHWLQDWELWALGELIDDLVVQNYAYSLMGFEKDLNQPALVKARSWGMPVEIGILAGFGGRTSAMATLAQKAQLATSRGHGVIYFYWEGLWGLHAGEEGGAYRQAAFRQLHQSLSGPLRPPPPLPLPRR